PPFLVCWAACLPEREPDVGGERLEVGVLEVDEAGDRGRIAIDNHVESSEVAVDHRGLAYRPCCRPGRRGFDVCAGTYARGAVVERLLDDRPANLVEQFGERDSGFTLFWLGDRREGTVRSGHEHAQLVHGRAWRPAQRTSRKIRRQVPDVSAVLQHAAAVEAGNRRGHPG